MIVRFIDWLDRIDCEVIQPRIERLFDWLERHYPEGSGPYD